MRRSPTKSAPTRAFISASLGAERSETRLGANVAAHGCSAPPIRSRRIIAANVPPVRPHFMKPDATDSREEPGTYGPITGRES